MTSTRPRSSAASPVGAARIRASSARVRSTSSQVTAQRRRQPQPERHEPDRPRDRRPRRRPAGSAPRSATPDGGLARATPRRRGPASAPSEHRRQQQDRDQPDAAGGSIRRDSPTSVTAARAQVAVRAPWSSSGGRPARGPSDPGRLAGDPGEEIVARPRVEDDRRLDPRPTRLADRPSARSRARRGRGRPNRSTSRQPTSTARRARSTARSSRWRRAVHLEGGAGPGRLARRPRPSRGRGRRAGRSCGPTGGR